MKYDYFCPFRQAFPAVVFVADHIIRFKVRDVNAPGVPALGDKFLITPQMNTRLIDRCQVNPPWLKRPVYRLRLSAVGATPHHHTGLAPAVATGCPVFSAG